MRVSIDLSPATGQLSWTVHPTDNHVEARSEAGSVRLGGDHAYRVRAIANDLIVASGAAASPKAGGSSLRIALGPAGLTVTSDRLGTVPLYLQLSHGHLRADSSLGRLGRRCGAAALDEHAAWELLLLGQPLGERTLLAGIRLMAPATRLEWDVSGKAATQRYWRVSPNRAHGRREPCKQTVSDFIEVLRQAHDRSLGNAEAIAAPVTGGLDSRVNLALRTGQIPNTRLFTVHSPGDPEIGIARRIARALNTGLEEIPFTAASWQALLDAEPWSEEIHRHQFWLAPVGPWLSDTADRPTLLDGYLQDALFNPRIVAADPAAALHHRILGFAEFRARTLPCRNVAGVLAALREHAEAHYAALGEPGLEADQRFYLENRSRRFVFDAVRLAQRHVPVALPGLDHELIDFAMRLPWNQRSGGSLYRAAIQHLSPALTAVPYDKTGLPLNSPRRIATRRRLQKPVTRVLNRLWPNRSVLRAAEAPIAVGLRQSPEFGAAIATRLDSSSWLTDLFTKQDAGGLLVRAALRNRRTLPLLLGAITIANLERSAVAEWNTASTQERD